MGFRIDSSHNYSHNRSGLSYSVVVVVVCIHHRNPTPKDEDSLGDGFMWPPYSTDKEQYASLAPNVSVEIKMLPARMAFWNTLIPSLASPTPSPPPTTSSSSQPTEKPTNTPGDTGKKTNKSENHGFLSSIALAVFFFLLLSTRLCFFQLSPLLINFLFFLLFSSLLVFSLIASLLLSS